MGSSAKKTFLVIDDDQVFANTVKDYLSSDTVEVRESRAECAGWRLVFAVALVRAVLDADATVDSFALRSATAKVSSTQAT